MLPNTNQPRGLNLASFSGFNRDNNGGPAAQQENAEFWLNIGYEVTVQNADSGADEIIFISLARGIPLDSIKPFDVSKAKTANMASLRDAQNKLHDMFMAEANKLAPGEAKMLIIDEAIGLGCQIKRVKAEQEIPQDNQLAKVISFERPVSNEQIEDEKPAAKRGNKAA